MVVVGGYEIIHLVNQMEIIPVITFMVVTKVHFPTLILVKTSDLTMVLMVIIPVALISCLRMLNGQDQIQI